MAEAQNTPLPQRIAIGVAVVVLLVGGLGLALGWFDGAGDEPEPEAAATPSAGPTTVPEPGDVDGWFPFTREEFAEAGATAQEFAAAYTTQDYTKPAERHAEPLVELATDEYAAQLKSDSGAAGLRADLAEDGTRTKGRASVKEVLRYSGSSVVIVVDVQTTTKDKDGQSEDGESYAVTLVPEGGGWKVHSFQPADVGQDGDLTTG